MIILIRTDLDRPDCTQTEPEVLITDPEVPGLTWVEMDETDPSFRKNAGK